MRQIWGLLVGGGILLGAPATAASNTLYVSKAGVDNWSCTAAVPCLTIGYAVDAAAPGDTIKVGYGMFFENLTIDKDLTIAGSGSFFGTIIKTTQADTPVILVPQHRSVTLTNMVITGGHGENIVGGIDNWGTLVLNDVRVFQNSGGPGSATIRNNQEAVLIAVRTLIDHNTAATALVNGGDAVISESVITRNFGRGTNGITNNSSIYVQRSLISVNDGSGVVAQTTGVTPPGGPWTGLTNVTISGNKNAGIQQTSGEATLTHVTVTANGPGYSLPGGIALAGGVLSLRNSIVAGNNGPECQLWSGSTVTATGTLLDGTCATGWADPTNLVGVDPKLSGLSGEGYKRTHALLPGSPAINAASPLSCEATDQRGVSRPASACDMGAYERVQFRFFEFPEAR